MTHYLHFQASSCNFEIWLNDVKLYFMHCDGILATRLPINHLLQNGCNNVKLIMTPLEGDTFVNVAHVQVSPNITGQSALKEIPSIAECDPMDDLSAVPAIIATGSFEYEGNKLPPIPWTEKLNEKDTVLFQRAITTYQKIIGTFATRNPDAALQLSRPRDEWFIAAYDLEKSTRINFIKEKYAELLGDEKNELMQANAAEFVRNFEGEGKLLRYTMPNGNSPLRFRHSETEVETDIPVYLANVDNKLEWIL